MHKPCCSTLRYHQAEIMIKKAIHSLWLSCGMAFCGLVTISPAPAQPVPDATLPVNSIVTNLGFTSTITGGTRAGRNLFHSFSNFSIPTKGTAFFNNAADIQNIISRVTGASFSNIDGLIKANGTANLFLINPNGIIFGPNARLNIGGSFLASTASSLKFADGTQFSATASRTTPLLTINVPLGLQFGANPGSILNQSQATDSSGNTVGLQVEPGKTLALVGGNVSLNDGYLQAPGGFVELGGVAGLRMVGLNVDGNNLSLSFPDSVARADVSLTNGAYVDLTDGDSGSIAVNARNLNILGGSTFRAGIRSGSGSVGSQAGDITLNATGEIKVVGSNIFNTVRSGAVGNGGGININTGSLSVTNGARLTAGTFGQGNVGSVTINARDTVSFDGESGAFSSVAPGAVGKGGTVKITTRTLSVTNGAQLSASTLGRGDAGSVNISALDRVSFDGVSRNGNISGASSDVARGAVGKGGDVKITTGSLSVTNGAQLSASTLGQGDAGSVTVQASGAVSFDGGESGALSNVVRGAMGKGGDVNVTTGSLSLTNGAQLSASTLGQGDAGSVTITASGTVSFDGIGSNGLSSGILSNVVRGAMGKGGYVNVTTGSLSVTNGAQLTTSTSGRGDAGSVNINARNQVSFDGVDSTGSSSGAFSAMEPGAMGKGGDVNVTTGSLSVTNGAFLSANTNGQGDAGSVTVQASGAVSFNGVGSNGNFSGAFSDVNAPGAMGKGGNVNVTAGSLSLTNGAELAARILRKTVGNGGDVNVTTGSLSVTSGSSLAASTFGRGDAGSVNINARDRVSFDGVGSTGFGSGGLSIVGSEAVGKGGDVNVTTGSLSVANGANLAASTNGRGDAGSVNINARDRVSLDGVGSNGSFSGAFSDVNAPGAMGKGGNVNVTAGSLFLTNGAELAARILRQTVGKGGDVNVTTGSLSVTNGAELIASTFGRGDAGSVNINARDQTSFDGVGSNGFNSGALSTVESGAVGKGGSINITTGSLSVTNEAFLSARSDGLLGSAGDLDVTARSIHLDNQGGITAITKSGNGGNINLQAQNLLLMRHSSQISSTAGTANAAGNGGNITIKTPFIVAVPSENSDISANAFKGNGGKVTINASSIFGTQFQKFDTSESDITATSTGGGVNGVVNINTLDINPTQGLVTLPVAPVDITGLIAQGCPADVGPHASIFVVTGRGGLPPNPNDPLSTDTVWTDLRPHTRHTQHTGSSSVTHAAAPPTNSTSEQLVEATGWVTNAKGEVVLTASAPTVTPDIPWLRPTTCHLQ